jgi:hypothetical protein
MVGLFLHIIKVIRKVLPSPILNLILSLVPISSLLLVIHKVQKLGDEIIKNGDQ